MKKLVNHRKCKKVVCIMLKKSWSILRGIFLALMVLFAIDAAFFSCGISPPIATYMLRFSGFIPRYSKILDVPVESNGEIISCSVYRRDGSPFLLVGPYPFLKNQSDFFFVAKDFVQVRFLDEKTDDWTRILKWVWIDQDMDPNGWDSYVPFYSFNETRTWDQKTGNVVFTLINREEYEAVHYSFAIPKHLLDALPE